MMQVTMKVVHSLLSLFYLALSLSCFMGYFKLSSSSSVLSLDLDLFTYPLSVFSFVVDISPSSSLFMGVVSLITSVVLIFSYSYMGSNYQAFMYLLLLNLFVLSMMLVITLKTLFMVMLGWDGLGVISFFLILYYQSPYSVFSAWFTILMNRLGDSFLILSIVLMWFEDSMASVFTGLNPLGTPLLVALLILGLMTKSALFPFSPWLPIAMSAPTPISSLVHSSTLVTAGLYLMMRLEPVFMSYSGFSSLMLWVSVFTSFYAGISALVEPDLKKLVALSTLSHLGFISMSLFSGYTSLAYFHLLAHALFKSLLFMGVGDWISVGHHYQDSRALSFGVKLTPLSSLIILSSLMSLLGLPFMVGFYSKDMILESLLYSNVSLFIVLVVYLNVFLTYCYTIRVLIYVIRAFNQPSPYFLSTSFSSFHYLMLSILSVMSFVFPGIYSHFSGKMLMMAEPLLHWLPVLILMTTLSIKLMSITQLTFSSSVLSTKRLLTFTLSQMLGMASLYTSSVSLYSITFISKLNKIFELGALNNLSQFFYIDSLSAVSGKYYEYSMYFLSVVLLTTYLVVLIF